MSNMTIYCTVLCPNTVLFKNSYNHVFFGAMQSYCLSPSFVSELINRKKSIVTVLQESVNCSSIHYVMKAVLFHFFKMERVIFLC